MFPLGCGGQTTKGGNPATINYRQDEPARARCSLMFDVAMLQRRIAKLHVPKRDGRSILARAVSSVSRRIPSAFYDTLPSRKILDSLWTLYVDVLYCHKYLLQLCKYSNVYLRS